MPERDGYIAGVPCWADTSQPDPEAAVGFYTAMFGWECEDVMPPGSDTPYFIGRIRGGDVAAISGQQPGSPPTPFWNTYIWVDSADETASKVKDAGGSVIAEPFDVMDSGRMAVLADPEGAVFSVWQAKNHKGSQIVNEHGAVNFNTLNTRDVEGAKAFYGAVFGWEAIDVGGAQMWALSAYGDHLEQLTPGLRKSVEEMGGPTRFEDVVASINPIPDDQADTPAHWGITFGVDDADAAAETAEKGGGRVLVPPFDAPWVRMTVISDPQGAVFTATKFVPENRDMATQGASAGEAA